MKQLRALLLAGLAFWASPAKADFAFTAGSGLAGFSFTSTTGGTALCAAASTHCFASVNITTAGVEIFTAAAPGYARIASGFVASGAYASGSIASGAVASGAFASGSIASGAIAAGAQVDLLTMRGTKNAGTAAANALLAGLVYNATPLTLTDTQQASLQGDANGFLKVNVASATGLAQGSTTSGQTGSLVMGAVTTAAPSYTTAQTSPISLTVEGAQRVTDIGATSGGLSTYFVQPAASDNHVVIKAGAGQIYKLTATNNSATVNYIRFYNATTGFNGCNSATNLVYQVAVPASTSGAGISDTWPQGMAFATGISICVTSGYATTDTTNATASAMSVNVGYK